MLQQQREYLATIRPQIALDVLKSPNRSLAFLIKENKSDAYVKAILAILISDTIDFLNVGKSMRDTQIMQTIDLMLEDFSVYKIDFFILCFNNAKKGFYGKQYDRVDGQIIFEWLSQCEYEYQSEIERNRVTEKILVEQGKISLAADQPDEEKQKLISDRDNTPVPMPENVKAAIHAIATKKVLPVQEREKTNAEIIIQGFIDDFNDLYENVGIPGGIKVVMIYGAPGKAMSIQDYIECRTLGYENGFNHKLLSDCLENCTEALKKHHEFRRNKVRERQLKNYKSNKF